MSLLEAYSRDGFAVVPDMLSAAEVAELREETRAIVVGERGEILGVDQITASGGDPQAAVLAIHFPHKTSPLMRRMLDHSRIVTMLTELLGPDVKAMQSMLFVKGAGKPGQAWHQDEHFIPTRDRSLIGVWIALDDATVDNGCLWMLPGSHEAGILYPTRAHGDPRFDNGEEAYGFPYEREAGIPIEVKAGGVAFFNGYTLHRSLDNRRTEGFRRALVNHYMSARSLLPWSFGIPPTQRSDFRDIVMVAGNDPYMYKGFEEITFPFVRPEDPEAAAKVFGSAAEQAAKSRSGL